MHQKNIIVALDYDDEAKAAALVERLHPVACRLKVGKELFCVAGPRFVDRLVARGFDVFLDLKFHDIPNTVARACKVAARMGVWMVNVHACGGRAMLAAAREAIDDSAHKPLLVAVTVLTSLAESDLQEIGLAGPADSAVMRFATLARQCGLNGVVCSGREAAMLKATFGAGFKLVTPGIRLPGGDADDQVRVLTPEKAISMGADYLVIGRPITQAAEPLEALQKINQSITTLDLER